MRELLSSGQAEAKSGFENIEEYKNWPVVTLGL